MSPLLIIFRGVPGSRKSTLACALTYGWIYTSVIVSEDTYWTAPDGSYHYTPETTPLAFAAMYAAARKAIDAQTTLIVVATAALDLNETGMRSLIVDAKQAGYRVFPLILQRDKAFTSDHDVSDAEMDRFRREMQHSLEI
jgi:hypothetical protein